MGVMVARTEKSYQQGLNRFWNKTSRFDFYDPIFANLGEQPIYNKELFMQGTDEDNEVFGYYVQDPRAFGVVVLVELS